MNFRRVLAVTKRVFLDLKNDKRTLALLTLAPIFSMTLFGLAFSGEVKDVQVIVVNLDEGATIPLIGDVVFANAVVHNLDTEVLAITTSANLSVSITELENGNAWAVIYFPENYTSEAILAALPLINTTSYLDIYIDTSNINVAESITREVNEAIISAAEENGQQMPVTVRATPIYGSNVEFMDFFVPGIMCFVVYFLTTLLTLITFVGERVSGTLHRVLATPLTEAEIVAGYAITFSVVGTLQATILLSYGILAFDVDIAGEIWLAFLVIVVLAIVSQALGILGSALAKREAQAVQLVPFIVMPGFLLSGVFWPLEAIPVWLRPASLFVPPTYAIDACRSVMLRGWGLDMVWHDVVALLIFAAVFLALASWSLRRRQ